MNKKNKNLFLLIISENIKSKRIVKVNNQERLFNYFEIKGNPGFVNINLKSDNELFLSPRLIMNSDTEIANTMKVVLTHFWSNAFSYIKSGDKAGLKLFLSKINEPRETRTGFANKSIDGNSIGTTLIDSFVESIFQLKVNQRYLISDFSNLELFLPGVNVDRISDMTISILKDILIKYTIENSVGINKSKFTKSKLKNVFDVNSNSWLDKDALLPVYNGIPVIFLPKNLLRKKSGVNCTLRSFYCFGIVNDIINDASYKELAIPTGKNGNYLLSDIKLVFSCTKFNILTLGLRKLNSLIDFNQVHNKRLKSLTDEDIESIISKSGK